jgi:hypothetical protein
MSECDHENFQCIVTGIYSFPAQRELDDVVLITDFELGRGPDIVQVEMICDECGIQRMLDDNEWEIA